MEYLQKMMKKTGYISIIESLICIVLGAILVWKAESAITVISVIIGLIFIVAGIGKIVINFGINKEYADFYNYELIYGLMAIVCGFIVIYYSGTIETIIRIIIGIWIIYSAVVKLILSFKIKQIQSKAWIASLVLSIAMFVCGMYVILHSGALIATVGVIMIIYSIIDIIEDVICIKNIKEVI